MYTGIGTAALAGTDGKTLGRSVIQYAYARNLQKIRVIAKKVRMLYILQHIDNWELKQAIYDWYKKKSIIDFLNPFLNPDLSKTVPELGFIQ